MVTGLRNCRCGRVHPHILRLVRTDSSRREQEFSNLTFCVKLLTCSRSTRTLSTEFVLDTLLLRGCSFVHSDMLRLVTIGFVLGVGTDRLFICSSL